MLDAALASQLKTHLTKISQPIELAASLDDSAKSAELMGLLDEIAGLSDHITVGAHRRRRAPPVLRHPPGRHRRRGPLRRHPARATSSPRWSSPSSRSAATRRPRRRRPSSRSATSRASYHFETYFSLSCQNCPDVVQALNLMSVLNPNITHIAIDGALFQDEVDARKVMAVPTVFLNGELFDSGPHEPRADRRPSSTPAPPSATRPRIAEKDPFDVLVVGGGPAGAAAAIYAARKGIRTGIAAERFGGQVLDTMAIENFISVPYTEGPKLVAALEQHVKEYDVDVMNLQRATRLVPAAEEGGLVTVELENGASLSSRTVVLSTGARWRSMGVPGEHEYRNKGVTYCPHCDGPLFKGKRVAVIGGGNSGVEAAIDLAGVVAHVTLIEFDDRAPRRRRAAAQAAQPPQRRRRSSAP